MYKAVKNNTYDRRISHEGDICNSCGINVSQMQERRHLSLLATLRKKFVDQLALAPPPYIIMHQYNTVLTVNCSARTFG